MVALPEEIDADYCVVEVVKALHDAKALAKQQNDTKVMMDVVAGWFELHERFVIAEDEDERADRPFGFRSTRDNDEFEQLEPMIGEEVPRPFEETEDENDTTDESGSDARL